MSTKLNYTTKELSDAIALHAKAYLMEEIGYHLDLEFEDDDTGKMVPYSLGLAFVDTINLLESGDPDCSPSEKSKIRAALRQCHLIARDVGWMVEVSDEKRANSKTFGGSGPRFVRIEDKYYEICVTDEDFIAGEENNG